MEAAILGTVCYVAGFVVGGVIGYLFGTASTEHKEPLK
jgi:hypothetical protein